MPVLNTDIADIFDEIADLLEIEGENPFRIRAYRNAARTLRELGVDIKDLLEKGEDLTELPGIGKDLADKITEVLNTGTASALEKLRSKIPSAIRQLLNIPGLGPKRLNVLYHKLDIKDAEDLRKACRKGRVRALAGFGAKTEDHILRAIEARAVSGRRFMLASVEPHARSLAEYLRHVPGVHKAVAAGSFRRAKETVGDLDILVTAEPGARVMDEFVAYSAVREVLSKGATRSSVVLRAGIQVDLRVVEESSFGAALHYFTGSKAHNIAIRKAGQKLGLKINEYGVFRGDEKIAGDTEESVFKAVGLPFIPPELREDRGEVEAAGKDDLPRLVELKDIRGDLHVHSSYTDGRNSIREMALAARKRGLSYIAVTDHSKRLTVTRGLTKKRLLQQIAEIDELNGELSGITVLKGIEVDILEDGSLDLPVEVLERLDLVIGAVHSKFGLSRDKQTRRILRALDHPCLAMLAHPTGRRIEAREPYDVDMPAVIRHARERGCFLELNANPERLDLADTYCRAAREEGVLVSINTDAHSVAGLDNLRFGVGQARRGWLEAKDVLNTRGPAQIRKLLGQKRRR